MKREDLLKYCRYYKGEKDCPKNVNRALWGLEMVWVRETLAENTEFLDNVLTEYLRLGLENFSIFDKVPITLKAVFLNRFLQHNDGMYIAKEFKEAYIKAYN